MKFLLLFLGFALANAATTITKNNDHERSITIHRNTPEKYPTEFELGKTHRFNYTGDIRTSFPQTGNETVGQRIQCIVELVPLTLNVWNMRLVEPTIWEINGTHDKPVVMINSTKVTDEMRTLLQYNVSFHISKGKIESVFTNKTEPEFIVNLKKGIMNMITLTMQKEDVYEVDEEGISGTCKTLYTVEEKTNEDLVTILNITKVRDLTNCSETAFNKLKTFKDVECEECDKDKKTMQATATFKYNITGTKQRFIINGVKSDARYVFFPMGIKGGSIFVQVNQTLSLINVTKDPTFTKSTEQVSRGSLLFRYPELVKVEEEMFNTVQKVNFFLEKLVECTNNTYKTFTMESPSHFVLLVRSLKEADYNTLENIWRLVADKTEQRKWLIEALPFVNDEDMTRLIKELTTSEETLLTTDEKITLLMRLGTIRRPTEKTVEYLKEICEHKYLQWPHNKRVNSTYVYNIIRTRYFCYRALGVQISEMKKTTKYVSPSLVQALTRCEETFDKTTKLTPWDSKVYKKVKTGENKISKEEGEYLTETDAKALLNTTKVTKVREMCLVAIGHAGLPDHIDYIEPILKQKYSNQTLDVRIAATSALRRMRSVPNKVLSLVLPILRNPYEDAELRITAHLVITLTNKRPAIYSLIGQELNREKSNQVRSFIYSHLKMLAEDKEPCNKEKSIAARYGLIFTKPINLGPTYSKVRSVRMFDDESKVGAKGTLQTIFSKGELTPSRTNLAVDVEMLGKKTPFLDVELRTSGLTNLVEKMFGQDGHYYKRSSVFDLLKPRRKRSTSTIEEELTKINKKVNPYEVIPEDPRVRLYISMFGNRILDLDINKEFLTTLIKEGKILTNLDTLDEELSKLQMINTTKAMILMDKKFEHPTIIGLPLSYNTTIGSILRVKINATVKAFPSLLSLNENITASFNITPEVLVTSVFKMGVHTPLIKFGSAVNTTLNATLPVLTNLSINFLEKKYEMLFPEINKNLTYLNFTHKMYTFFQKYDDKENHSLVNTTLTNRKPIKEVLCISLVNDTKQCLNITYVPRLGQPESPFLPLSGPIFISVFTNKTKYGPKTTKLQYLVKDTLDWERAKEVDIKLITTGLKRDLMKYENISTYNIRVNHPDKRIVIENTQSSRPEWRSEIRANVLEGGEVDVKCMWGDLKSYNTKINNTETHFTREYYLQINSQNWARDNTRNITVFWAELPEWLKNVTYLTKKWVLPVLLETVKKTNGVDYLYEPLNNTLVNSTTVSLKIKTNYTLDVELHLPIEKITLVNVTVPVNTSVLNHNIPKAVDVIKRRLTEKYLSGNCTFNHTGKFETYDKLKFDYNLTGSCQHVLTKDCSPSKRFTVLVQNTRLSNNLIRTRPVVTVYIDNHRIELITKEDDEVSIKYDGMEEMSRRRSRPLETEIGTIERNETHITMKCKIGLTVVYSKYNVTTYLSPWYVNKTCGLCGDFNGETFLDMKCTGGDELTNSTKFGSSWIVQGDDCKDRTCKLSKEELYALPETVYLANKPAACFSKEPVKVCPVGCNKESPENIFTGDVIPTKQYVKIPFFCMTSENVEETKEQMKTRSELIKSQPVDLYREMELPHDCVCTSTCNQK